MGAVGTIVYESETGFTRQYALLLAGKLGISTVVERKKTGRRVRRRAPIIYMGWIMGGRIVGLARARARFNVRLVCAVGMGFPHDGVIQKLILDNNLTQIPTFYLQGGCAPKQLGVFKRNLLGVVADSLEHKDERTPEEDALLEMLKVGASYLNPDYLDAVVDAAALL
jgi:hypothetical protein